MISTNWRRGLFRLWIAASFVWLVGAGAFLQEDIRREFSVLMTAKVYNEEDARRLAAYVMCQRQARSKSGQEASSASPGSWKAAPLVCEFPRASLGPLRQRAQGDLIIFASVLLLPPILLFALGWAGLWIMRGFRS